MSKIKTIDYSVSGTHCRSCELLIENEVKKIPGVKNVSASTADSKVKIEYKKSKPSLEILNKLFKDNGYSFSEISQNNNLSPPLVKGGDGGRFFSIFFVSLLVLIYYFLLKSDLLPKFNVSVTSYPPAFFFFGLLAGFSTCAALVGGLVLSLSQSWSKYKLVPVLSFNFGRLIIFTVLGGILGYFGSFFRLSITLNIIITILVSLLMLVLGLQMLGLKAFQKFSLALPKSFTSKFSSADKFQGQYLPFILGGLTFFLPCGFTLTAQSLALASGKPITGALIMAFFTLGTFIPLFLIGLTGAKITGSKTLSQITGLLLLVFAFFNLKNQYNLLDFNHPVSNQNISQSSEVVILKMSASASGYTPNKFQVKAGQKIRWEITDTGTSGCTNGLIARSLFSGIVNLVPGTTSVKEFVAPSASGTYHFSCWMGMISGTIEVI